LPGPVRTVGRLDPTLPESSGNRLGHHVVWISYRYRRLDSLHRHLAIDLAITLSGEVPVLGESDSHPPVLPPGRCSSSHAWPLKP